MLDATSKKLLRLLGPDRPLDLRRAAVLVLGEVGSRTGGIGPSIIELLTDPDPALRLEVLRAVGKLRLEQALPQLVERITAGGPESEAAAQAAARLGPRGTRSLRELMTHVSPGLRRRIAGALASTTGGEAIALDSLLDSDPGVVDAAARSLSREVPALSEAQRKGLADGLLGLLKRGQKTPLAPPSALAVLRILSAVNDPRSEAIFWERTEPAYPPEQRALALQALGQVAQTPTKDRLRRLLACAADADFRVAAPALLMLKTVPVTDRSLPDWLKLLDAPDVAVRRLVLERVGERDNADVAQALVHQLDHRDRALRDEAARHLAHLEHGREALVDLLLDADTPDRAWLLARSQAPFVRAYGEALRDRLFKAASSFLEAEDRRADALWFLLREADPAALRDRLEERGLGWRKKKQYAKALLYFRLVARDPSCGAPLRFELAATGLKLSSRDLSAEARVADPCLEPFAHLLQRHGDELLGYLKKAKWLEPEELFYLGFHFAEKDRAEQQFGGAILRLVVERSPRSAVAKDARSKLRSTGLE